MRADGGGDPAHSGSRRRGNRIFQRGRTRQAPFWRRSVFRRQRFSPPFGQRRHGRRRLRQRAKWFGRGRPRLWRLWRRRGFGRLRLRPDSFGDEMVGNDPRPFRRKFRKRLARRRRRPDVAEIAFHGPSDRRCFPGGGAPFDPAFVLRALSGCGRRGGDGRRRRRRVQGLSGGSLGACGKPVGGGSAGERHGCAGRQNDSRCDDGRARGFGDDGEGRCGEGRFGPGRRVGNRPSRRNLRTQRRDSSGSDDGAARGLPDARSQFGHRQGRDDGFACKRSECAPRNLRGIRTHGCGFEGCEKRRPRLDGPRRAGRGRRIVLGARRQFGPQRQCGAWSRGLPWKRFGRFGSYGRPGSRSRGSTRNGSVGEERGGSTRGKRWSAWGRQRPWEPGRSARFDGRTERKLRAPGCVRTEKRNVQARCFATARGVGWKGRHRLAVCPRRSASVRDDKGGRRIGCRKKAERRGGGSAAPRRAQPGLRLRARQGSHLPGGRNLAVRRGSGLAAGQGGAAEDRRGGGLAARSDRVAAEQGDSAQRRGKFLGPRDLRQTNRSAYS